MLLYHYSMLYYMAPVCYGASLVVTIASANSISACGTLHVRNVVIDLH